MHSIGLQSLLFLVLFPPIGAAIWWVLSRGWAATAQGGNVSDQTRKRQRVLFWVLLVVAYFLEIAGVIAKRSQ